MKPCTFLGVTHKLVAADCHDLPAQMYVEGGLRHWETRWHPSEEELKRLVGGCVVVLTVLGSGHPPVKIEVYKP